jgi:hypothetical protein
MVNALSQMPTPKAAMTVNTIKTGRNTILAGGTNRKYNISMATKISVMAKSTRPTTAFERGIINLGKYIFWIIPWAEIIEFPAWFITKAKYVQAHMPDKAKRE